jgi:hypothetical protein
VPEKNGGLAQQSRAIPAFKAAPWLKIQNWNEMRVTLPISPAPAQSIQQRPNCHTHTTLPSFQRVLEASTWMS